MDELRAVLARKFGVSAERIAEIDTRLRTYEVEPIPRRLPDLAIRDPSDLVVLASAISVRAEFLVTGDADLLELRIGVRRPRIVSPREFRQILRRKSSPKR